MTRPAAGTADPPQARPVAQALRQAIAHMQSGNTAQAISAFTDVLDKDPDNGAALVRLGTLYCASGDFARGIDYLSRAVARLPGDAAARGNLVYALNGAYARAMAAGDHAAAVGHCRALRALQPDNPGVLANLSFCLAMAGMPATLDDFAPGLSGDALGAKILVACMPKSGSTWLTNALVALTGFASVPLTAAHMENEQELHLPHVISRAGFDTVTQQHCRATTMNMQIMQAFGIRPVVLVRNLFDTLVSLNDFYEKGAVRNTFFYKDFDSLDAESRLDLIVDVVAPWYVQFHVSWVLAETEFGLPFLWMTYEEMMEDKTASLTRIAAFQGLTFPEAKVAAAVAATEARKAGNRLNKGVSGRGAQVLSQDQKDRVRRLTRYFPSVDFGPIGLA